MNPMVRLTTTILTTILPSALVASETDATLECLRENIEIEVEPLSAEQIETRAITAVISNNTSVPLGGVFIEFTILAKERPAPLFDGGFRDLATISGGLLPGETMSSTDYHFMEDRELGFATSSEGLSVVTTILNAADAQMQPLIDGPAMGSWSDEPSPTTCKPNQ